MAIILNRPFDCAQGDSGVNSLLVAAFGMIRMHFVLAQDEGGLENY
jgi:hypothetical protein